VTVQPLLPNVNSPLAAPFWAGARNRKLVMQRCAGCGTLRWPPKPICPTCQRQGAPEDWQEIPAAGEIWSFVVYHRAFHPSLEGKLPYNVAYIRLDAGPMFISNVVGTNDLAIGQRVKARYDDATPEVTLVRFELASAAGSPQSL
jgi:uncharacterized OB-fold protein